MLFCQFDGHGIEDGDCMKPQHAFAPACISSQLKTCSLIGYKGTYAGIQFIKYILKNAKLLNTVTISLTRGSKHKETNSDAIVVVSKALSYMSNFIC